MGPLRTLSTPLLPVPACLYFCRCVEQVSFAAPELSAAARAEGRERYSCVVDKESVEEKVAVFLQRRDLSKWII